MVKKFVAVPVIAAPQFRLAAVSFMLYGTVKQPPPAAPDAATIDGTQMCGYMFPAISFTCMEFSSGYEKAPRRPRGCVGQIKKCGSAGQLLPRWRPRCSRMAPF